MTSRARRCPECGYQGWMLQPENPSSVNRTYMREYMRRYRRLGPKRNADVDLTVAAVLTEMARAMVNGTSR